MISISLKEFVLTGKFGPITLGMLKEEVIRHLGEPESDHDFGTGYGCLIYGWYELFYLIDNHEITGIQNDHLLTWGMEPDEKIKVHMESICFRNEYFEIDIWFLRPGEDLTYDQVKTELQSDKISFEEYEDPISGKRLNFISGVYFDFDNQEDIFSLDGNRLSDIYSTQCLSGNGLLNGIRLFKH